MPSPIDPETRERILDDIDRGQLGHNAIARKHRVAAGTVTNIANEHGREDAFDRSASESATRAQMADLKERRAALAAGLLEDAELLRDRAWDAYEHVVVTKDGVETVDLVLPPLSEVRNAYAAIGIATDKHLALLKHDTDPGAENARSLMAQLGEAFQIAAAQIPETDEPDRGDADPLS